MKTSLTNCYVMGLICVFGLCVLITPLHAQFIITEFMASNTRTLPDEDGDYSDWIEIYNTTTNTVDIGGWYLTANSNNLTKWMFPATNINAKSYLVVYASNKDRTKAGAPLHTNFKLGASGEYLALVKPGGIEIAMAFTPKFPPQASDVSYGFPTDITSLNLITNGMAAKFWMPDSGSEGLAWNGSSISYSDGQFTDATLGMGYIATQTIAYVGQDRGDTWRSTNETKLFDPDGDGAYGTSGYILYAVDVYPNSNGTQTSDEDPLTYFSASAATVYTRQMLPSYVSLVSSGQQRVSGSAAYPLLDDPEAPLAGVVTNKVESGLAIRTNVAKGTFASMVDISFSEFPLSGVRVGVIIHGLTDNNMDFVTLGSSTLRATATARRTLAKDLVIFFFDLKGNWAGQTANLQLSKSTYSAGTNYLLYAGLTFDPLPADINTDLFYNMMNMNSSVYLRVPFSVSTPGTLNRMVLKMKYDDGFIAYINGQMVASRNAPVTNIAHSVTNFSGVQGSNGWYYGYYDRTADGDGQYQTNNYTQFTAAYWNGSTTWGWNSGTPPFTSMTRSNMVPNGTDSGNEQWAIKRWKATVSGTYNARINFAKAPPYTGDGVTLHVFLNGTELFSETLSPSDSLGITTNLLIDGVMTNDFIDFAVDPLGPGGTTGTNDAVTLVVAMDQAAQAVWYSRAASARVGLNTAAEEFDITPAIKALRAGANMLAIHGLNVSSNDLDFLVAPTLSARRSGTYTTNTGRYFSSPTPGTDNPQGTSAIGPLITDVTFSPAFPKTNQPIVVTARVVPTMTNVSTVTLVYRIMFTNEISLTMVDDGLHGDGLAGDRVYGATIPTNGFFPGCMIRWCFTARDARAVTSRLPVYDDPNNSPQYFGTITYNPGLTNPLPVMHRFVEPSQISSMNNDAIIGARCSIYWNGEFYDNLGINRHGQSSGGFPRKSFDVDFNPGFNFKVNDDIGRVDDINLFTTYADKSRMRSILSYGMVRDSGAPYHYTIPIRVQENGAFWGDALIVENGDANFLKRHGLDPNGALYKTYNDFQTLEDTVIGINGAYAEKKTRKDEDSADLRILLTNVVKMADNVTAVNTMAKSNYIMDNVNVPNIINFMAGLIVTANKDCCHKNHYMYRDTEGTGQWYAFVWDVDLSFGRVWSSVPTYWDDTMYPNTPMFVGSNHGLFGAMVGSTTPGTGILTTRQMYLRRVRTLMDKLMQPPGTPYAQRRLESQVDALVPLLYPDARLDVDTWGTWGGTIAFGTNRSTCCTQYVDLAAQILKNDYLEPRRTNLFIMTNSVLGAVEIPPSQPTNFIVLVQSLDYNPASGRQSHEFICITNPNSYAVDISDWHLGGAVKFTFEPGTVIPTNSCLYVTPDLNAFRTRSLTPKAGQGLLVVGNYQGQLSARGEVLTITDDTGRLVSTNAYSGNPSLAQQFLRITEIMYHPSPLVGSALDANEYEYIELKNISENQTVSLLGVHFTNGVDFAFMGSAVTSLTPGQRVLVVRNITAFVARYGNGLPIAGQFLGSLDNAGERIKLEDSVGEVILDFSYNNSWYPLTDGLGFALQIVNENAPYNTWDQNSSWRASGTLNGSPGLVDPPPLTFAPILVNEALTHTDLPQVDTVELFNPTGSPLDISGWLLTDDFFTPNKYRFTNGTVIPAYSFLLVTETNFNPGGLGFSFSSVSDEVYIFSADAQTNLTGYYHGYSFAAALNGVAFGRYVNSQGQEYFVSQETNSLGFTNGLPRVGPVVISEIMYHPPDIGTNDNSLDEFIELLNTAGTNVPLFHLAYPTNAWQLRGVVDFDFPTNIILTPGSALLLVNFSPTNTAQMTTFRAQYRVATNVAILGPYSGKLNNDSNTVKILMPDNPNLTEVPYGLVDQLDYQDRLPWSPFTDGTGFSLQRRFYSTFGNDPTNWAASPPSAGVANTISEAPSFTQSPVPYSQIVTAGQVVSVSVPFTGAAPVYQLWNRGGTNYAWGTNGTLMLTNIAVSDGANYEVILTNIMDMSQTVRTNFYVSVISPATNQVVSYRANVTMASAVSGTGSTYQWSFNGTNIINATNYYYLLFTIQPAQWGIYTMSVSNRGATASYNTMLMVDSDRDGMPDAWETAYGFNPNSDADAHQDADGDGFTNLQEFLAGTGPHSSSSRFTTPVPLLPALPGGPLTLQFTAPANRSYTIESRTGLVSGAWQTILDVPPSQTNRTISLTNTPDGSMIRMYRLVIP